MMTKFKVGDKVFIKQSLGRRGGATCCYGVNREMLEMCWQVVTIESVRETEIDPRTTGCYRLVEDPHHWAWSDDCFEPIQQEIEDADFDIGDLL